MHDVYSFDITFVCVPETLDHAACGHCTLSADHVIGTSTG